jgi:hypothetical protein
MNTQTGPHGRAVAVGFVLGLAGCLAGTIALQGADMVIDGKGSDFGEMAIGLDDFDGDGHRDFAVTSPATGQLYVFYGPHRPSDALFGKVPTIADATRFVSPPEDEAG